MVQMTIIHARHRGVRVDFQPIPKILALQIDGVSWEASVLVLGLTLGLMKYRLYIVSVRTDDESGVVLARILRTQTGRAIVLAASVQGRAIEGFDLISRFSYESDVKRCGPYRGLVQAKRSIVPAVKLDTIRRLTLRALFDAQWFECLEEESLALRVIANSDIYVVKHLLVCSNSNGYCLG